MLSGIMLAIVKAATFPGYTPEIERKEVI